jgi:hypothetical protein
MLAHHYVTALELARAAGTEGEALVDQARRALVAAADRAFTLNAFGQTVMLARQALELSPEGDAERPYILLRIGRGRRYSDETGSEELIEARDGLLNSTTGPRLPTPQFWSLTWPLWPGTAAMCNGTLRMRRRLWMDFRPLTRKRAYSASSRASRRSVWRSARLLILPRRP